MITAPTRITPPIKWHGGKHYLASKIVARMPPHLHYVEPYAGGLAVLLARDPEGVSEVVNDLNGELTNFWQVLQERKSFECFRRRIEVTPFSEPEWRLAGERLNRGADGDPVGWAVAFFIRCRQSLAGRMKSFTGVSKNRTRRGMNNEVSAWWTAVEGLPEVHKRLKRVLILNRDALDVIRQQDEPKTLFYLDPPYLHQTRASTDTYDHEMTPEQHAALIGLIRSLEGKVMISGYDSELYRKNLSDWEKHTFKLANHAAGGKRKRRMTECLWCNF